MPRLHSRAQLAGEGWVALRARSPGRRLDAGEPQGMPLLRVAMLSRALAPRDLDWWSLLPGAEHSPIPQPSSSHSPTLPRGSCVFLKDFHKEQHFLKIPWLYIWVSSHKISLFLAKNPFKYWKNTLISGSSLCSFKPYWHQQLFIKRHGTKNGKDLSVRNLFLKLYGISIIYGIPLFRVLL